MNQAVILAGGRGTRLAAVSGDLPKPLVPVGGTPILQHQIELLARYGVREIFITTGYKADVLETRLGNGADFGLNIVYVREEVPLGTAGGVAALRGRLTGDFFVLYGDVMVCMDLAKLARFHRTAHADATIVVHPNDHPYDSDLVEIESDGRVCAFHPKPHPDSGPDLPNMVSAALYLLSPGALAHIEPDRKQDFVRDVFPRMLGAQARLFGYHTTEYLKDMGTPDRLERVEHDQRSGMVTRMHADNIRPTVFLDRDGVINEEIDGVHSPDQLRLLPGAGQSIRRLNRSGWLAAVVSNQPHIAKGFMTEQDLAAVHRRLEAALGRERAWLDTITCCPHHPEKGFPGERPELKMQCTCRKPAPGLLERVAAQLPVDRNRSVMIGDSWRDMAAAHAFGIDAIGVLTGHGLRHTAPVQNAVDGRPDLTVKDLPEAVSLLLDPDDGIRALAGEILAGVQAGQKITVTMGGLSRSGKSVAAFQLRRMLREEGCAAVWVKLDDWLVPASQRPNECRLTERYRLTEAQAQIQRMRAGAGIEAPGYDPRTRATTARPVAYRTGGAPVVIIEGVPALLLQLTGDRVLRVQILAPDEQTRIERLRRFYHYKGFPVEAVENLIAMREEEYKTVQQAGRTADMTITPSALDRPQPDGDSP